MSRLMPLLFAACLAVAGCSKPSDTVPFNSVDVSGSEFGKQLALTDQYGKPRSLADFKGKVAVVFFGYTQCPDVCPTTMADLAAIKKSLGAEGDKVQGVFVSVDPDRDTPEVLKAYMANFDPSFIALRGTPEQTKAAAQEFKVFYAKVPGKTPGSYTMDHTAGSYVFDADGHLRLFTRYGMPSKDLAADLKRLIEGAAA